jgi:hypothetical protein
MMIRFCKTILTAVIPAVLLCTCATPVEQAQNIADVSPCHIIYDAGSSGTRLYVYARTAGAWVQHRGPDSDALADPVRAIRGKTMSDADAVVDDIVTALEKMLHDGPPDKKGQPKWSAFDWCKHCNVKTAAVYATAGMRLAEQLDAKGSGLLWKKLNDKLSAALDMNVTTRSLTGYEEGLFAWLAIREGQENEDFGVAEMGGASVQITFPCPQCKTSRQVRVKDHTTPIYSYSLLGWGQDEAWKKLHPMPACERGIGKENPGWKIADCSAGMDLFADSAAEVKSYVINADELHWYRSGAFRYMQNTDIEFFCRQGIDSGFEPETSCFRAVYLQNVLNTLGLPAESEQSDVSWTLGAVVCTANQCLQQFPEPVSLRVADPPLP